MENVKEITTKIIDNISKVIIGKNSIIETLLVAVFCEGHILINDVPGMGKTMLAKSLAKSIGGTFNRIQCTPDLLPNDITGVNIYRQNTQTFEFNPGPVFVNILLADEINRATPRTQSALLEAMQESQVTLDGVTHLLPDPFITIATQNPIDFEGTFPLPEAQLDRFMMQIHLGYPSADDEILILKNTQKNHPFTTLSPIISIEEISNLKQSIWEVHVDETIYEYIVSLTNALRNHASILLGPSPRATIALVKTTKAYAAIKGRDHVIPDDVKYLFEPVLKHRLILQPEANLRGRNLSAILDGVLKTVPIPLDFSIKNRS